MRIKQVLETIRRVETKFKPIYEKLAVLSRLPWGTKDPDFRGAVEQANRLLVEITYELGEFVESTLKDADAVPVLTAFGLKGSLLARTFWLEVVSKIQSDATAVDLKERDRDRILHQPPLLMSLREHFGVIDKELLTPWRFMVSCAKPLTILTIPRELLEEQTPDDILAINLSERETVDLKTVLKVLSDVESLYETVNRIFGNTEFAHLQILKIESGTGVRIDLKGFGSAIKELKNAILEIWNKHRHKKADEIIDQHRIVASSIDLLSKIDSRVKKRELSNEDGIRFKRVVVQSTLGLFKNGALIEEIPRTEIVDNVQLLSGFAYKLLAAPEEPRDVPITIIERSPDGAHLLDSPSLAGLPSAEKNPTKRISKKAVKKAPKRGRKRSPAPEKN